MVDFLLVHLDDSHSVMIWTNLTSDGRGDHHLQRLIETPGISMIVTTKHFFHSSCDKLVQLFESQVFFNIKVEFLLFSIINEPWNVLENDDMSHASLSGGLQLSL